MGTKGIVIGRRERILLVCGSVRALPGKHPTKDLARVSQVEESQLNLWRSAASHFCEAQSGVSINVTF
jgi:hypothetical protein